MKRRTPRGLDPDEEELWQRVARTTTPLKPQTKLSEQPAAPEKRVFTVKPRAETMQPKSDLRQGVVTRPAAAPLNMDRKAFQKMRRGKSAPEARLDLHGMTVSAAHGALTAFILSAQAQGKRLVLVITGKGRASDDAGPIPARTGVLRRQVPQWLELPPLKSAVLQVSQAHQRHGGSGAYYVYLRRR